MGAGSVREQGERESRESERAGRERGEGGYLGLPDSVAGRGASLAGNPLLISGGVRGMLQVGLSNISAQKVEQG